MTTIVDYLANKGVNRKKIDSIVSSARIQSNYSNQYMKDEEIKDFLVSKFILSTGIDLSRDFPNSKDYANLFNYHVYPALSIEFLPNVFSEFVTNRFKSDQSTNLLEWRKFTFASSAGKNSFILKGALNKIDILDEKTKENIKNSESELDEITLEMKQSKNLMKPLKQAEVNFISWNTTANPLDVFEKWEQYGQPSKVAEFKRRIKNLQEKFTQPFVFKKD